MPPEQAAGKTDQIGPAADIYALGAVLYALLTGRPPFQADNLMDTLLQVLDTEPVAPRALNPKISRDLETICMKCLEKEPSKRYATAGQLSEELARYLRGDPIQARPISRPERTWRWCKKNPLVASLAVAVLISLLAGTAISTYLSVVARARAVMAEAAQKKADGLALVAQNEAREAKLQRNRADDKAAQALLEKERADAKADEALQEKERAEEQLRRSERLVYASQIASAQQAWQDNDFRLAREYLNQCRWDLRGWEHDYLSSLIERQQLRLPAGRPAFGPSGSQVAIASLAPQKGWLAVWNVNTGSNTLDIVKKDAAPFTTLDVTFSPDGRRIARVGTSHDSRRVLQAWDATSGQIILDVSADSAVVRSVAFGPDGERIVTGGAGKTAKVWDISTGQEILSLGGHKGWVGCIAYSPDGKRIVTGDGATVHVWDAQDGKELYQLAGHTHDVTDAIFSPDGERIYTAAKEEAIRVWDATSGQQLMTLTGRGTNFMSLVFDDDGTCLAAADRNGVTVWDVATGQTVLTARTVNCGALAFNADRNRLVGMETDGLLTGWDVVGASAELAELTTADRINDVALSPDGSRIVSAGAAERAPGQTVARYISGQEILAGELILWDTATGREITKLAESAHELVSVDFSPDGERIVAGGNSGSVAMWDARSGRKMVAFEGHTEYFKDLPIVIRSVAFSPDGRWILSGGGKDRGDATPGELKLWDALNGRELASFEGHQGPIICAAFRPDGKQIVSAARVGRKPGEVKVWDPGSGHLLSDLSGHRGAVGCVAYSPDGRRIVTAGPTSVRVWDSDDGQLAYAIADTACNRVWFGPDNRRMIGQTTDGKLQVWDAASGQLLLALAGDAEKMSPLMVSGDGRQLVAIGGKRGDGRVIRTREAVPGAMFSSQANVARVHDVAVSPDGSWFACGGGFWLDQPGEVWLLDATTGQDFLRLTGHATEVNQVAISPDGKCLASASGNFLEDGEIRLWDIKTGQPLREFRTEKQQVLGLAFSPDGNQLFAGTLHGWSIWDTTTGNEIANGEQHESWQHCFFAADGEHCIASGGALRLVHATTGRVIDQMEASTQVRSLDVSPDGRWVACADHGVLDATTGQQRCELRSRYVAFSHDGQKILGGGRSLQLLDAVTGREIRTLRQEGYYSSPAFGPDDQWGIADDTDGIGLWDFATGRERLRIPEEHLTSVAISPNGRWIAGGGGKWGEAGVVKLWDARTGELVLDLTGHADPVNCVAFSPDSQRLVSGSKDLTVRIWDTTTGEQTSKWTGHKEEVKSVAFSLDGKSIVSSAYGTGSVTSGEIKLWDVTTGKELAKFSGVLNRVDCVRFSPDGARIFSGGTTTRVWDAATGRELHRLLDDTGGFGFIASTEDRSKFICLRRQALTVWKVNTPDPTDPSATGSLEEVLRLKNASSAALSPDGERIVTGGSRFSVWDADDGRELLHLPAHGTLYFFTPDGKCIVGTGGGARIQKWNVSRLLEEKIREATRNRQWLQLRHAYRWLAELEQDDDKYMHQIAATYAAEGQWEEAATMLDRRTADFASDRAVALLADGDRDSYREVCAQMLQEVQQIGVLRTVRICTAGPQAIETPDRLVLLMEREIEQHPHAIRAQGLLGAALYRVGRFSQAVATLGAIDRRTQSESMFLAMAWQQIGEEQLAHRELTEALAEVQRSDWLANHEAVFERAQSNLLIEEAKSIVLFADWPEDAAVRFDVGDPQAVLVVDGNKLDPSDYGCPVPLPAGEHTLVVSQRGQQTQSFPFRTEPSRRYVFAVATADQKAAEQLLDAGAGLEILIAGTMRREVQRKEDLPVRNYRIIGIHLDGSSDDGDNLFSLLPKLGRLRVLDVHDSPITDAVVSHLAELTDLRELDMGSCADVTDEGVRHLRVLKHLISLDLSQTQLSDEGVAHLSGMQQLNSLQIQHTAVTGEELQHLAGLTLLRHLNLGGLQISDESLAALAGCAQLEFLNLSGTAVTGRGLSHLAASGLRELDLHDSQVDDDGLENVLQFANLAVLDLGQTQISDRRLPDLGRLRHLEQLNIEGTAVTVWGVERFKQDAGHISRVVAGPRTIVEHAAAVRVAAFSRDDQRLFCQGTTAQGYGYDYYDVRVWDSDSGQQLLSLEDANQRIACIAVSPDSQRIVGARGGNYPQPHEVLVWDANTGEQQLKIEGLTGRLKSLAFSPDGRRIAGGVQAARRPGSRTYSIPQGEIRVWDATTGEETLLIPHRREVSCVAFSPDGKQLVATSAVYLDRYSEGKIKVWDAATGEEICTPHTSPVDTASFSPDGQRIVGIAEQKTVHVWNATTGALLLTLQGDGGTVTTASFSPDGKQIVTASGVRNKSGELKIWVAESGELLLTLQGHDDLINSIAFSHDGSRLCTSSRDKTLKIWNLSLDGNP
jgi:WD40 repeat protein